MEFAEESQEEYLKESVSINRSDLNGEFMRLSSDMAYWNEIHSQSVRAYHEAKLACEISIAELGLNVRDGLERDATVKKVTEGLVESTMKSDPRYREALGAKYDAEHEKTRVMGIVDAIRAKRDMLISLGAMVRTEMKHDPTILEPRTDF